MQRNSNYLIIAAISIQVLFIIALIIALPRIFQSPRIDPDDRAAQPSVTIRDLGNRYDMFSSSFTREIENQFFYLIQKNNVSINLGDTIAVIRDGSANHIHFEDEKFDFYNFIVDIPELQQSYQLFLTVSEVENNQFFNPNETIIPLCLSDAEEKIYPNFECKDIYGQKTRNMLGLNYSAYFNSDKFFVVRSQSTPENLMVMATDDIDVALTELKDSIKLLGISPDLFTYDIYRYQGN